MMGAEPTLKLKTADFWQLTRGMQLSSSSSSSLELLYIFFGLGLDIQIIYSKPTNPPPSSHLLQSVMLRREQQLFDRYASQRKAPLDPYPSREVVHRPKCRNSELSGGRESTNNLISAEIYSQPQLVRPRRGASANRNSSKTKNANSMSKFRKDFVNSCTNIEPERQHTSKGKGVSMGKQNKNCMELSLVVEELHYQMVTLQQNVKKMNKQS